MEDQIPKNQHSGLFKLFGEIRKEERARVLLMSLNLAIILIAYYIIKVIREPLILGTPGGALSKSYSAAGQALVLMGFIPLYSWFSSKVNRMRLILGLNVFFLLNIEFFSFAVKAHWPYVRVAYYIWVGIFSLSVIAQFWSLANDLYSEEEGKRLFPVIAIGATLGAPIGSKIASLLFQSGISADRIMHLSSILLIVSMFLYYIAASRHSARSVNQASRSEEPLSSTGGFRLVFNSRYLFLIAMLILLLNAVNQTGETILGLRVKEIVVNTTSSSAGQEAMIGSFYGNYFFAANVLALLLQAFAASRIVKYLGMPGVVLMLPLIALGGYLAIAFTAALALIRGIKIAENATDYSVMNTAKAMLWLSTDREEKYKAKQTTDTFFFRMGDVMSAAIIFIGTNYLHLSITRFALVNVFLTLIWIVVALVLLKEHRMRSNKAEMARAVSV